MPDLHTHDPGSKRALKDVHGIFCGYVCDKCEAEVRARCRPEIFTDPNYDRSEPLDED